MINISKSFREFKGQNVVTPWDRLKKHVFGSYPIITTKSKVRDPDDLAKLALQYQGKSKMVWVAVDYVTMRPDFPWHYRPSDRGQNYIHEFPKSIKRTNRSVTWGDLQLVPTDGVVYGKYRNKITANYHDADFDVFMISYHEEEADRNFQLLKQRFPDAKHVKNVEGIGNAHKECAKQSSTEMVYIVDADADIMGDFHFDYVPPMAKRINTTYVWSARNPINGLEYGYGGIKLFPREQLLEMGHILPDFTAGVSFYQPVSNVSNVTRFNKDPYRTWRSAFRECVKLSSGIQQTDSPRKDTVDRLEAWCTLDNGARFGRYFIKGALEGKAYGEEHADDVEALNKINDFEWLREQFVASMKKRITP